MTGYGWLSDLGITPPKDMPGVSLDIGLPCDFVDAIFALYAHACRNSIERSAYDATLDDIFHRATCMEPRRLALIAAHAPESEYAYLEDVQRLMESLGIEPGVYNDPL